MDTTPPQENLYTQTNPLNEGSDMSAQSTHSSGTWWTILLLALALVAGWMWASWLYGWFPFLSEITATSEKTMQDIPQSVLDSLAAPIDPSIDDIPQSVLDSLTAPTDFPSASSESSTP